MACFLVSAAEAVVVTAAAKATEKQDGGDTTETVERIPFSQKLKWLSNMLWGGAILLVFEHIWHGEIVPWFPFLTAMNDPADTVEMLHEMMTVGVAMAVIITAVWLGMVLVTDAMEKKVLQSRPAAR